MKNNILNTAIILAAVLFSGCNFLETDQYHKGGKWATKADFDNALIDLYVYQFDDDSEDVTGTGMYLWEVAADNVIIGRIDYSALEGQIHNMQWNVVSADGTNKIWKQMYIQNTKANNIISEIEYLFANGMEFDMDLEYKKLAIAEAKFARAYAMLWIAPYYGDNGPNGGIPIILDTTPVSEMDSPRPSSVLKNYDQIIADFRAAADGLPFFSQLEDDWYGRAHKAAAWALCARAALYAAQYDPSYYDVVIEMCDNIINIASKPDASAADARALVTATGEYPDGTTRCAYGNLFTMANNYSAEYIWSFVGNTKGQTRGPQFYAQGMNNGGWSYANTWGKFQPTWELYKAYEEGDQRRDATIFKPGDTGFWFGEKITLGAKTVLTINKGGKRAGDIQTWDITSTTGMLFRKYMEPFEYQDADRKGYINCNSSRPKTSLGQVVMRYADVLLMKAEALIWTKGEGDATARELINQVRTRAGLPANSNATKAQLKQERNVEFAYEFQPSRLLDLIRWGDAAAVFNKPTHGCKYTVDYDANPMGVATIDYNNPVRMFDPRTFDPAVNHVVPIPSTAFNGTKNLTQNQGY